MPVTIMTSKDLVIPIGAVFGLKEDTESLKVLHEAFDAKCRDNGLETPVFKPVLPQPRFPTSKPAADAAWFNEHLKDHLCPPEWETVLLAIMRDAKNFDELLEKIWDYAGCIRIYTKPRSQVPDYTAPVVLRTDQRSMASFVNRIHRNLLKSFKHAIVWGRSVKHQPQRVGKQHVLEDEDIVQIVKVGSG